MAHKSSKFPIDRVAEILREETAHMVVPIVTEYARRERNPFQVLVSTILSLRTKDACTAEASKRLFERAQSPRELLELDVETIAGLIYPVGFYKTKAQTLRDVCQTLIERFGGQVPNTLDELLSLKGVGRKTANLVLTQGYGLPGICVDTHVHRITNRWGYVHTKSPEETEMTLRQILPPRYWIEINDWLVAYGQNLCKPVSPWCSRCRIRPDCPQIGVERSR
jgi:endonuclease-3